MAMKDMWVSRTPGFILLTLVLFALSGCAASYSEMALKSGEIDTGTHSVALFTVVTKNELKPEHIPTLRTLRLRSVSGRYYRFRFDRPDEALSAYLVSIALPAGRYTLLAFDGESSFYRLRGRFTVPLYLDFELKDNSITYLGRIHANNRKRGKGERRSGPLLPHIHQKESGFASGTFDVTVLDKYDGEIEVIKERFPSVAGFNIEKAVMVGVDDIQEKSNAPGAGGEAGEIGSGDSPDDY